MTIEANKALVRRYLDEVWHGGAPAEPFFAPGYRRHVNPGAPPLDSAAQAARIRAFREAFPDIRFALVALVAEGDRVVFHCRVTGTHRGPLAGNPPTDRAIDVGLIDIVRIEDGLFVEHWGGADMLAIYRQLGLPLVR